MVKKIRNPETGRMVNVTGKIGQKVLSQRGGSKDKRRKSAARRNSKKTSYKRNSKKSQKKPNRKSLHGGKPRSLVGKLQNMSSHFGSKFGADLCVNVEKDMGWYPPNYLDGKLIPHIRRVGTCMDILDAERLKNATETILTARKPVEKLDNTKLKNILKKQNDPTITLSDSELSDLELSDLEKGTIRNYVKDNTILNQAYDYLQRINPDRGLPFPDNDFGKKN